MKQRVLVMPSWSVNISIQEKSVAKENM